MRSAVAARLDLATAYLASGDMDGVRDKLTIVLEAEPGRRAASISNRLRVLSARLAEPAYARPRHPATESFSKQARKPRPTQEKLSSSETLKRLVASDGGGFLFTCPPEPCAQFQLPYW